MTVRLIHDKNDALIPHQVVALDGVYLAGFRTQGQALGYVSRKGWKVAK